jgi:toxin-antitoxin system PIN domain toxin
VSSYLCDANVWLALALSTHVHHAPTRRWLDQVEQPGSICFCRATQQSLLRLLTTAAILRPYGIPPLSNAASWDVYEALIADDRITRPSAEPVGLESHWRDYARRDSASPKLWMDAYLAGYAKASERVLVTTDRAFAQFEGLEVRVLGGI